MFMVMPSTPTESLPENTQKLDLNDLASRVFEDLDAEFRTRFKAGDFVVAGEHFGCGSSREQAPLALKAVGVRAVIAKSFARIFIAMPLMLDFLS